MHQIFTFQIYQKYQSISLRPNGYISSPIDSGIKRESIIEIVFSWMPSTLKLVANQKPMNFKKPK